MAGQEVTGLGSDRALGGRVCEDEGLSDMAGQSGC
jgi:hypothetical protein